MINLLLQNILRYLYLFLLRFKFNKSQYFNFKDLNFKQNDFINYKIIKHYVLKDKFIKNTSIIDIHTFNFLLFYQKIGGKKGIELSKKNVFIWFKKFKYYNKFPWTEDYSSKRLINIIYSYDYICSISNQKEIKIINDILYFHIKRILFEIKRKKNEEISSFDALALVLIECSKKKLNQHISRKIIDIVNYQVDNISIHKSYNILEHAKFLNNLIEIKNIFLFYNLKIPKVLDDKILAMTALLGTYRHDDLSMPLFNGCNNNHNQVIQKILKVSNF